MCLLTCSVSIKFPYAKVLCSSHSFNFPVTLLSMQLVSQLSRVNNCNILLCTKFIILQSNRYLICTNTIHKLLPKFHKNLMPWHRSLIVMIVMNTIKLCEVKALLVVFSGDKHQNLMRLGWLCISATWLIWCTINGLQINFCWLLLSSLLHSQSSRFLPWVLLWTCKNVTYS